MCARMIQNTGETSAKVVPKNPYCCTCKNASAVTTEGSTKGTMMVDRRSDLPRNRRRYSSQLTGNATTTLIAAETADCHTVNHTARHAEAEREPPSEARPSWMIEVPGQRKNRHRNPTGGIKNTTQPGILRLLITLG